MATGPLSTDAAAALQAERDALARRCAETEARVEVLEAQLTEARSRIEALEAADRGSLSLFDGDADPASTDRLTGDGSDPRVLSMVLAATAVVAAMVAVLALLNGKLGTPFGLVMIALTIALAWGAARTRVVPVEVSFVRGMVYIQQGETSYRFDLRKPETAVEMVGAPGDAGWAVRFGRRGLDPFVLDASMVDPADFTRRLRELRPDI